MKWKQFIYIRNNSSQRKAQEKKSVRIVKVCAHDLDFEWTMNTDTSQKLAVDCVLLPRKISIENFCMHVDSGQSELLRGIAKYQRKNFIVKKRPPLFHYSNDFANLKRLDISTSKQLHFIINLHATVRRLDNSLPKWNVKKNYQKSPKFFFCCVVAFHKRNGMSDVC